MSHRTPQHAQVALMGEAKAPRLQPGFMLHDDTDTNVLSCYPTAGSTSEPHPLQPGHMTNWISCLPGTTGS